MTLSVTHCRIMKNNSIVTIIVLCVCVCVFTHMTGVQEKINVKMFSLDKPHDLNISTASTNNSKAFVVPILVEM